VQPLIGRLDKGAKGRVFACDQPVGRCDSRKLPSLHLGCLPDVGSSSLAGPGEMEEEGWQLSSSGGTMMAEEARCSRRNRGQRRGTPQGDAYAAESHDHLLTLAHAPDLKPAAVAWTAERTDRQHARGDMAAVAGLD